MQFTFETAYYALSNRAQLKAGETVLVLGAGGGLGFRVGSGRARNLGGRVIAAGSSQEKVDFACRHGASGGLVYPCTAPEDRREVTSTNKGPSAPKVLM